MDNVVQDLNDLFYFTQVVEHQGFAAAGRALGMPKSKLSRRIAALERRLNVRLVQRSSRKFSVTAIGREYYRHCKAVVVEAQAAQEAIDSARAEPQGVVRVSCPLALLHFHVGAMLTRFMAAHPRVQVHLDATNRRVDVIQEGFDLALRVRFPPLEVTDLITKMLGNSTQCLVASPTLLRKYAPLRAPAGLSALPSLDLAPAHREHAWQLTGPDAATVSVPHAPRLVTDDMLTLRAAALAGAGIVQLPAMTIQDELRSGSLVHVLPQWLPPAGLIHAVFPSRRGLLPSVRALVDFLAVEFKKLLGESRR